jgi:putative ABC transport system ATP-binding protein
MMLSARELHFAYPSGEFALRVPEFQVQAGETVGIRGPSGTGKTTFLRLLSGILSASGGELNVCGDHLEKLSPSQRRALRIEKLGLVFQDFELLDYLSVEDNILLPARLHGTLTASLREAAHELAERLEMARHWKHLAGELSQGERQRVAVARALAHSPRAVLADEPTSSIDAKRRTLVMDLLTTYAKEKQAALVLVTHDTELFARLDRTVDGEEWAQ